MKRTVATRRQAEQRGRRGERIAQIWLALRGWRTLAKRVRNRRGEVDLVMRRGNVVAFVEVKWRRDAKQLDLAIDMHRLRRVAAAAEACAHDYVMPGDDYRIDVMLVAPGQIPRHIVNAWQP